MSAGLWNEVVAEVRVKMQTEKSLTSYERGGVVISKNRPVRLQQHSFYWDVAGNFASNRIGGDDFFGSGCKMLATKSGEQPGPHRPPTMD